WEGGRGGGWLVLGEAGGGAPPGVRGGEAPRGECGGVPVHQRGRRALGVLPAPLASAATRLQFPKSMRWDAGDYRFGRPVRWLLALLGKDVVPVKAFGLEAGRSTYGHRFLHPSSLDVK